MPAAGEMRGGKQHSSAQKQRGPDIWHAFLIASVNNVGHCIVIRAYL